MSSSKESAVTKTEKSLLPKLVTAVDSWSNAFWRLTVPSDLLSQSTVVNVLDQSGNTISAELLYGERKGKLKEIPYDHSEVDQITDLSQESLWIYDSKRTLDLPSGFEELKQPSFYISTGKVNKCHKCKGRGQVKCWNCGGRGSVKRRTDSGRKYWEPCSHCSSGWVDCRYCSSYGWIQHVIDCTTQYKIKKVKHNEYTSPVPDSALAKVTGQVLFEEIVDYPQNMLRSMLVGGIDANEYFQLQAATREKLQEMIESRLTNYEGNIQLVHKLVNNFFKKMPNPARSNKLLEYEIIPVRLQIKVERKPIYQIAYTYKSKPYTLQVFGNEEKVYASRKPREVTQKLITLFAILIVSTILIVIILFVN